MTQTLAQEAAALRELKNLAAKAKDKYDSLNAEAKSAEHLFFERMAEEGVNGIKVDGTNFVPAETVYGQVQDRQAFIDWCGENAEELVELKERKALVNELVREKLDNGEALPPGLGFYVQQYVSQRAG